MPHRPGHTGDEIYDAFMEWLDKQPITIFKMARPNKNQFRNTREFAEWVTLGHPGFSGAVGTQAEMDRLEAYGNFMDWRKTYVRRSLSTPKPLNFEHTGDYKRWVEIGNPGYSGPLPTQETPTPKPSTASPATTVELSDLSKGIIDVPEGKRALTSAEMAFLGKDPSGVAYTGADEPLITKPETPEEPEKYQGYTGAEWTMKIPQFIYQKEQDKLRYEYEKSENLRRQGQEWADTMNEAYRQQNEASRRQYENQYARRQQELASIYGTGQMLNQGLQKQAEEFELWRSRMISQMQGPAYSVARWFVQHKPNEYQKAIESAVIGRNVANFKAELDAIPESSSENLQMSESGKLEAAGRRKDLMESISDAESQMMEADIDRETAMGLFNAGPAVPEWAKAYLPGVGTNFTRNQLLNVQTPSGQQLNRMLPGQADYLAGTIDFLGGNQSWQDATARTAMMVPKNPSQRFGYRAFRQGRVA